MPRPRRRGLERRIVLYEWEERWATGATLAGDEAAEPYFLDPTRARDILVRVRGATWVRGLTAHRAVTFYNRARVARLESGAE